MRCWLLVLVLIFAGCTSNGAAQPTLRGPIVPTRLLPTATSTPSPTATPTATFTLTPSLTPSNTPTDTATFTATFTLTPSATSSDTQTATFTLTPSPTALPTLTPSTVPTDTPTITPSTIPLPTLTPSETATVTPTPGQPVVYRNSTSLEPVLLRDVLTLDNTISGTIDDDHPAELYTFAATAGSAIDISMTAASGDLDPYLLVLDPKGREMARNDDVDKDHHDAAIHVLPVPENGTYVIVATRYGQDFGSSSGDFDLTVTASKPGETAVGTFSQATGYDSVLTGTLNSDTSEQNYTFRAAAGDVITIQMTHTSGDLDANLTLTNNLGTTIVSNDDNLLTGTLDAAIQRYIIPKSGYYTLIAGRVTGSSDSGDYRLKLTRDSQHATDIDAIVDPINSTTVTDEGKFFSNYTIGDQMDENNHERTLQTLLTFRLPPNNDQRVQRAVFQMLPCFERGGGFATLGQMTIYQDSYGKINQTRNITHPLPGARVLSTQSTCAAIDLTSIVQDAYANGNADVQLRLLFRNHSDNGVEDQVLITPRLVITFGG